MPLRIAYTRPDGGVSIVNAAAFETLAIPLGTKIDVVSDGGIAVSDFLWSREAYVQHVIDRSVPPDATNVVELPEEWDPGDRSYRDAWTFDGKGVTVDMPKARDIHRARIRADREPLMSALDVEFIRSLEGIVDKIAPGKEGDAARGIIARKQALRDAPADPAIEEAETPDELSALPLKAR